MKNRYKGICNCCGKEVLPKQGYFRDGKQYRQLQNFDGLRCHHCALTTKANIKHMKNKYGLSINGITKLTEVIK
jgi:hypothetical protein